MLVIIEGADGSGKTSLVTLLRKRLGYYLWILRSSGPPKDVTQLAEAITWLSNGRPKGLSVISDRFPLISEFVYGNVIRGKCIHALSPKQIAQFLKSGPDPVVIVYCRPSITQIEKGVRVEEQMPLVREKLHELIGLYDRVMMEIEANGVRVIRYDYTGQAQLLIEELQHFLMGDGNVAVGDVLPGPGDGGHSEDAREVRPGDKAQTILNRFEDDDGPP